MKVRKAVIPAAGFGTRFLPATKSQPKEMLPIVDKPVIQYVVEEAVEAGITDILIVIGKGKRAIEEHFDRHFDLENELMRKGRSAELEQIRSIAEIANIHFVWQKELRGLGDAVSCARWHVGREPFAVLLGDTLIESTKPVTRQLCELHEKHGQSAVVLEDVPRSKVSRYGVIDGSEIEKGVYRIRDFIEKPDPEEAPSTLAIAGRYVLTPEIFDYLDRTPSGKNNEIQLTDAMKAMVKDHPMVGWKLDGIRYDIGNKLDFIKTNVLFGLRRPDMQKELAEFVRQTAQGL